MSLQQLHDSAAILRLEAPVTRPLIIATSLNIYCHLEGLMRNCVCFATILLTAATASAQPSVLDHNLAVRTVATGLASPTTMAFLGTNEMFVLEKATGKVQHVMNGTVQATPAVDLAVNSAVERGLLGIALDPA